MKRVTLFIAALTLPQAALAEPPKPIPQTQVPTEAEILTDDLLDVERGGEAVVVSNQTLTAISEGSTINGNYNAGSISITDSALSNFNGIGNLVINTGAQNNLQSGMNVTINVTN
jgi:hypothetical protein